MRIKFKKVYLVGFIIQFITMHGQYNFQFSTLKEVEAARQCGENEDVRVCQ